MFHFKAESAAQGIILSALLAVTRGGQEYHKDDHKLDATSLQRSTTEQYVVENVVPADIQENTEYVTHQTFTDFPEEVNTKETNFENYLEKNLNNEDFSQEESETGGAAAHGDAFSKETDRKDNSVNTKDETVEKQKTLGAPAVRLEKGAVSEEDEELFHPVSLPTDFSSYDVLRHDGVITLDELIDVTGAHENVELAFNAFDKDGDGKLTLEEFLAAPWSLAAGRATSDEETEETPGGETVVAADEATEDDERSLDAEIKRYLLTPEELQDLEEQ